MNYYVLVVYIGANQVLLGFFLAAAIAKLCGFKGRRPDQIIDKQEILYCDFVGEMPKIFVMELYEYFM